MTSNPSATRSAARGRWRRSVARTLLVAAMIAGMASTPPANAANGNEGVFSPGGKVLGKSMGAWAAAWWQYALRAPVGSNPLTDPTGQRCRANQSGQVFFLVGTFDGKPATRNDCVVPAGKALFFPMENAIDIHVPGDSVPTEQLVWDELHGAFAFAVQSLHASIDGVPVRNLDVATSPYRACAGPANAGCSARAFGVDLPSDNLFGGGLPAGHYEPAVADGFYLMLKPLAPGRHTVTFGGRARNANGPFNQDITYHLTVRPAGHET